MSRALPWILAAVAAVSAIGAVVSFAAVTSDDDSGADVWSAGMMLAGTPGPMMRGWAGEGPVGDVESAKAAAERALDLSGYRGFRVAEAMRFENGVYVAVEESDGVGALELIVDPLSGAVFPEPGPNMMWNTRYGMMAAAGSGAMGSGMMGPDMMGGDGGLLFEPDRLLTAEQAVAVANEWLAGEHPGEEAGEPRAFPGYFTLDTEASGEPTGMLSVNAATGAVWLHAWHRGFLDEREW